MDLCFLEKKCIHYSLEECIAIFGKNKIEMKNYLLLTFGKIQGVTYIGFLTILKKETDNSFFIGVYHQSNLQNYLCYQVHSLTAIRQAVFGFEDQLSFERSTFLWVPKDSQLFLVRLKCCRSLTFLTPTSTNTLCTLPPKFKLAKLSKRTKNQFKKCLQQIYTSYVRDLGGKTSEKQILESLQHDIHQYLNVMQTFIL